MRIDFGNPALPWFGLRQRRIRMHRHYRMIREPQRLEAELLGLTGEIRRVDRVFVDGEQNTYFHLRFAQPAGYSIFGVRCESINL